MNKTFRHSNFSKISTTIVFGIALFVLLKILFLDGLFDKNGFGMAVFLSVIFGVLSIVIGYVIIDVWVERILVLHNRIVYRGVFGKKEIFNSNIKGYYEDGNHTSIYSKDNSIIISFDNRLKNEEKFSSYLESHFECLEEE